VPSQPCLWKRHDVQVRLAVLCCSMTCSDGPFSDPKQVQEASGWTSQITWFLGLYPADNVMTAHPSSDGPSTDQRRDSVKSLSFQGRSTLPGCPSMRANHGTNTCIAHAV
jgi:hypothetical protein